MFTSIDDEFKPRGLAVNPSKRHIIGALTLANMAIIAGGYGICWGVVWVFRNI